MNPQFFDHGSGSMTAMTTASDGVDHSHQTAMTGQSEISTLTPSDIDGITFGQWQGTAMIAGLSMAGVLAQEDNAVLASGLGLGNGEVPAGGSIGYNAVLAHGATDSGLIYGAARGLVHVQAQSIDGGATGEGGYQHRIGFDLRKRHR